MDRCQNSLVSAAASYSAALNSLVDSCSTLLVYWLVRAYRYYWAHYCSFRCCQRHCDPCHCFPFRLALGLSKMKVDSVSCRWVLDQCYRCLLMHLLLPHAVRNTDCCLWFVDPLLVDAMAFRYWVSKNPDSVACDPFWRLSIHYSILTIWFLINKICTVFVEGDGVWFVSFANWLAMKCQSEKLHTQVYVSCIRCHCWG